MAEAEQISKNQFAQFAALKAKWLPSCDDSITTYAQAIWLERKNIEDQTIAVNNGIIKAFEGEQ